VILNKLQRNVLELYEPLKPKFNSVITYNILFLIKRIVLVLSIVVFESYSGNTQIMINGIAMVISGFLCIFFVRFKNPFTMVLFYLTELITLLTFILMLWYENQENMDDNLGLNKNQTSIDRIIMLFITSCILLLEFVVLIEAAISCKRRIKGKQKPKDPQPSRPYLENQEEEKGEGDL